MAPYALVFCMIFFQMCCPLIDLHYMIFSFFFCSTVLIEFALFCTLTSEDPLSNFADEAQGKIMVIDFLVHCLRHDDIVHKVDSVGYRVFLTTTFFVSYFDTLVFVHLYNILYFFLAKRCPLIA